MEDEEHHYEIVEEVLKRCEENDFFLNWRNVNLKRRK